MRIALYGLSCSGKDFMLDRMPFIEHIKGSEWLNARSAGKFRELPSDEQDVLRREFIGYIRSCSDRDVAVDGHYAFPSDDGYIVVFTEDDGDCYDVFAYLDTPSEIIHSRLLDSEKNSTYADLSVERIEAWKGFEIEGLRNECMMRGKEFLILDDDIENVLRFMEGMIEGRILTAPQIAERSVERILSSSSSGRIVLCDGDKTLTSSDLTKRLSARAGFDANDNIFYGDRYSTYQFWLAYRVFASMDDPEHLFEDVAEEADVEGDLLYDLSAIDGYRVVVSAGLEGLWEAVVNRIGTFDMAVGSSTDAS